MKWNVKTRRREAATPAARDSPRSDGAGCKHPGLIAVFVGVQLLVGLKYLQIELIQARNRIRGVHGLGDSAAGREEGTGYPMAGFPLPRPKWVLSGVFQRDFETAARKHFPLARTSLIPWYCHLSMRLSRLSVAWMPGAATKPRPLWGKFSLMQDGDGPRLCGLPVLYLEADRGKLADRARYYNGLHAAWPGVRFHICPVLPVADWYAVGGQYGSGSAKLFAGDRYVREFRSLLHPAIAYTWAGEWCSWQEAISCCYRTDHHWNFQGAYQIYRQLWRLLRAGNDQMGQPFTPKRWIEVPGVVFYGYWAHAAGCFDDFGDPIHDAIFDLPELAVRIHGFEGRERNAKSQYPAGHYRRAKFTNHYGEYFGTDYGLIEYTAGAVSGGNLLVVNDSYDNCLEPLLASHFSQCWFVDLRYYAQEIGQEFDMDDFLVRHGITDVLFLGQQPWLLGLAPSELDRQP